jgi:hypothetical protein
LLCRYDSAQRHSCSREEEEEIMVHQLEIVILFANKLSFRREIN